MDMLSGLKNLTAAQEEYVLKKLMGLYKAPTLLNRTMLTHVTRWYLSSACNIVLWTAIRKQSTYGGFQCIEEYLKNCNEDSLANTAINALVVSEIPPLDSIYEKNAFFKVFIYSASKNKSVFNDLPEDYIWTPDYVFNTVGHHDLEIHKDITIANISITYALYQKCKSKPEIWRECKDLKHALDRYISGMDMFTDKVMSDLEQIHTVSDCYQKLSSMVA